MSSNLKSKNLLKKLENGVKEVNNETLPDGEGGEKEIPQHLKNSLVIKKFTNIITQHLADNMLQVPEIRETKLKFGSGDTGRQTQLILKPSEDVDKNDLHKIATKIHILFEDLFPTEAMIGVKHGITGDGDGNIVESDDFHLFVVYNVRSAGGGPSKPAGDSTEVFYNKDYS